MPSVKEREAKEDLKAKIDALPPALLGEVDDFVEFMRAKRARREDEGNALAGSEEDRAARPPEARGPAEKHASDGARDRERYSFFNVLRDADLPGPKDASVTYEEKLYGPHGGNER